MTKQGNWIQRNYKLFVLLVSLGGLLLFAGFLAAVTAFLFGMLKSSDPYKQGLARAQASPEVMQILGTPIEPGFFTTGSIHVSSFSSSRGDSSSSGNADIAIPISGPKGKATLFVVAKKSAGQWVFEELVVEVKKPLKRIDLKKDKERLKGQAN